MGIKEEHWHMKQQQPKKEFGDSVQQLPREFTWRTEMPECLGMIED